MKNFPINPSATNAVLHNEKEIIKPKRYNSINVFCQKCGEENKEGATFCNKCGADLRLVIVFPEHSGTNSKHNNAIIEQISVLEGQKKGHVGPIILVFIGIALFFIGRFPGLFELNLDTHVSTFGKILMIVAVIWDVWRINSSTKLEEQIEALRAEIL